MDERVWKFNIERALILNGVEESFHDCLNCDTSDSGTHTSQLSGINSEGVVHEKTESSSDCICECRDGESCMFCDRFYCLHSMLEKDGLHSPPDATVLATSTPASATKTRKPRPKPKGTRPKPTNRRRLHIVNDEDMNIKLKFETPDKTRLKVNFDTQATICCCSPAALEQLNKHRVSQGKQPIETEEYGPGIRVETANDITRTHKHFTLDLKDTAPWGDKKFIACKFWVLPWLQTDWILGRNHGRRFHYVVAHRSQLKDDIDNLESTKLNIGGSDEVQRANNPNLLWDETFLSRLDHPWHNKEFFDMNLKKWILKYKL